ncbi:hypothetical protein GDO81_009350 [Engystomops pustulosus]|uniref:Uncharacterized protein n=1 Tax=Engystomops pustulosus TaxID=76066 RepID=A0AAV7BQC6_ENGPU|nr:hypothetical protein GDO81_009350 [Engystomops pustulosus]
MLEQFSSGTHFFLSVPADVAFTEQFIWLGRTKKNTRIAVSAVSHLIHLSPLEKITFSIVFSLLQEHRPQWTFFPPLLP